MKQTNIRIKHVLDGQSWPFRFQLWKCACKCVSHSLKQDLDAVEEGNFAGCSIMRIKSE